MDKDRPKILLDEIIEQSPYSIWISDVNGYLIKSNKILREILGVTEDQIVGEYNILKDENLIDQGVMPQVEDVFTNKKPTRFSIFWAGEKSGNGNFINSPKIWIDVTLTPIVDNDGNLLNVVCQWIDITKQINLINELEEGHKRLEIILDSIDADIYVADIESFEILFMNVNMQKNFNGNFVGEKCWKVFRGESKPCDHCNNDELLDNHGNITGLVTWEGYNPISKKWYINYDRAIRWIDNRLVRLQISLDITNKKEIEDKLRQSETQFKQIFNHIGTGIAIYEVTGDGTNFIFKDINPAGAILSVVKREEIIGKNLIDVFPGVVEIGLYDSLKRVWKTGKPEYLPTSLYHDDIRTQWVENYVTKLPSGEVMAVYEDVTEKKLAEQKLIESEQKYQSLFSEMVTGNALHRLIYDDRGNPIDYVTLEVNKAYEQLLGADRENVIGIKASEILPEEELKAWLDIFAPVVKTGKSTTYEIYSPLNSRYFQGSAYRPAPDQFAATFIDVTEQKKAQEQLLKSEASLKKAQQVGHLGSWAWDIRTNKLEWSDEMFNIFGIDKKDFFGDLDKVIENLIHPEDQEILKNTNEAMAQQGVTESGEYRIVLPDGKIRNVWAEAGEIRYGEDGRPESITGILLDITDRKKIETDLRIAYDATLEGWAKALDLRDKETQDHTKRVVELTMKLAELFGVDKEQLINIRRGALLHDIGKLSIPDSILHKPDNLTDDEWKIMMRHPVIAKELIEGIDYLKPAIDIPYCHHEKWDGSGYPQGLRGEEIPFAARLFAVVDVWDALNSDRPYRKAWPREKCLKYLKDNSGKHFDPNVVEVFLEKIIDTIE